MLRACHAAFLTVSRVHLTEKCLELVMPHFLTASRIHLTEKCLEFVMPHF
jgi:hypothetical protein